MIYGLNSIRWRAKNGARERVFSGGSRVRTGDPMLAKHVLYQLSYTPI